MKVALIANISANGKVLLSENTSYQAPQEAMELFMRVAARAGNLVLGRKTFEMLQRVLHDTKNAFPGIELVLIAGSAIPNNDHTIVKSMEEAISYLTEKGSTEIAVGGGTITYNAFLEKGLVTDVYFNIHPVLVGNGGVLITDDELTIKFKLISATKIDGDITQIHLSRQ